MNNRAWKYNNLLLEAQENIDGIKVNIDRVFSPTKDFIIKRYNQFNDKYFDSKLVDPDKLDISIVMKNSINGLTIIKLDEDTTIWEPTNLLISRFFERNEKDYCSILLHEMIHVYQCCVLKKDRLLHDADFINKMQEINKKSSWNITEKGIIHAEDRVYPSVNRSLSKSVLIAPLARDHYHRYMFIVPKSLILEAIARWPLSKLYYILDTNFCKIFNYLEDFKEFDREHQI